MRCHRNRRRSTSPSCSLIPTTISRLSIYKFSAVALTPTARPTCRASSKATSISSRMSVIHKTSCITSPRISCPCSPRSRPEFAVFNRWFASIPGPTVCNRAFAHYGTSFGKVDMNPFEILEPFKSVYERLINATPKHTAKIYYYDTTSSTIEVVNLLQNQPELFGTYQQFLQDCAAGNLPDYSFVEPNYSDHGTSAGEQIASDQHPDHNVQAGELFIASVYNAIKQNADLWTSTALLIVYDEHGGIYDHVPPPACTPDQFTASANDTGTGMPFAFDRLGVRVPAILVSPWIPSGTVVNRVFDHASIPATVTKYFLGDFSPRSPRETSANLFVDPNQNLLSLADMRTDCPDFST